MAATLSCEPVFADFGSLGLLHLYHVGLVSGATYTIEAIDEGCDTSVEDNFSSALSVDTSQWGDVCRLIDPVTMSWPAPDGTVDIVSDVVACLDCYGSRPHAPIKARVDVEPNIPDQLVNITDCMLILDAFRGLPYPMAPASPPCPQ